MPGFISLKSPTVSTGQVGDGREAFHIQKRGYVITDYRFRGDYHCSNRLDRAVSGKKYHPASPLGNGNRGILAGLAVRPVCRTGLGQLENLAKGKTSGGTPRNADKDDGGQPAVYSAG
ncbi:hypothetical protein Xmir_02962 [Xenorhabdus miraniensis]|uniref:Uncharacterized protein n=1 Tax=Xenorhabdus miraniensis TaxID=351674 RepID=A0A2D0JMU3_9GAMM|nr:hypothetical protein Xmir_02962 [Xenorhabdus miraniensis]